jgi:hypothetical protein
MKGHPMGIEYLSHEWYVREVERLGQQLRNMERYRDDVQRRNWMLVEYMARQGVPLDEVGMREAYEFELAGSIRLEDDERRLENFRKSIVQLMHDTEDARGKVDSDKLLGAVVAAIRKTNTACMKKAMSAAQARERAAKATASIPRDVPHDQAA